MIADLVEYYQCVSQREDSPFLPKGYSKVTVNFKVELTKEGLLKDIVPYVQQVTRGKKLVDAPKLEIFPWRNSISGIAAETIDHREKYNFGVLWDKKANSFQVSEKAFEKNKEKNLVFLEDISSPVVDAYKLFLEHWKPEEQTENPVLLKLGEQFINGKFVIALEYGGGYLHKDPEVLAKWDRQQNVAKPDDNVVLGQCAISGKQGKVARLHTKLKGVGGLATGVSLVTFNAEAFESYGKTQSYNSSISQEAMEQYTEAFNFLASDLAHRQSLDDMTLLFWALTKEEETPMLEAAQEWMGFGWDEAENSTKGEKEVVESLSGMTFATSQGRQAKLEALQDYANVDFFILGVRPNSSRLSIKFYQKNKFGTFQEKFAQHQKDTSFSITEKPLGVKQILNSIKSPVAPEDAPPDLQGKLLESILSGKNYPDYLLHRIIYRMKVDKDDKSKKFIAISSPRVRLLRGCLIRKKIINWEETTMLNLEITDEAYLCGRLFAVLENIQQAALGYEVNATIKDKFFTSACSTPYLVFPRLVKLSQNHLNKVKYTKEYEETLGEIIGKMEHSFPKTLNMEAQGVFILGYYQQKDNYIKKIAEAKTKKQSSESEEK